MQGFIENIISFTPPPSPLPEYRFAELRPRRGNNTKIPNKNSGRSNKNPACEAGFIEFDVRVGSDIQTSRIARQVQPR
jgi:hypothetical protein